MTDDLDERTRRFWQRAFDTGLISCAPDIAPKLTAAIAEMQKTVVIAVEVRVCSWFPEGIAIAGRPDLSTLELRPIPEPRRRRLFD